MSQPKGPRPPWQARYVASLEGQGGGGRALASPGRPRRHGPGQRWIAISDGGAGLEDLLQVHFGRVDVVILDFYYASEHLGDFAKVWCSGDAKAAEATHGKWAHRLNTRAMT